MYCIHLRDEALSVEEEMARLASHTTPDGDWTNTPQYHAWRAYLRNIAITEGDPERLKYFPKTSGMSSVVAVRKLVEDGVPRERLTGMFILLFT